MSWRDELVKWKVRFQIGASIFSIFGMPYLVANAVKTQLLNLGFNIHFGWIIFMGVFFLVFAGLIYDVSGLFSAENGFVLSKNEAWVRRHEKKSKGIKRGKKNKIVR